MMESYIKDLFDDDDSIDSAVNTLNLVHAGIQAFFSCLWAHDICDEIVIYPTIIINK